MGRGVCNWYRFADSAARKMRDESCVESKSSDDVKTSPECGGMLPPRTSPQVTFRKNDYDEFIKPTNVLTCYRCISVFGNDRWFIRCRNCGRQSTCFAHAQMCIRMRRLPSPMRFVFSLLCKTGSRRKERTRKMHEPLCRLCRMLQDVRFTLC